MPADTASLFGPAGARAALRDEAERYVARSLVMMNRARALVEVDRSGAVALLNHGRTALGGHFQRYQRFKHGRIFDPVIREGLPSSRVVAHTMKIDCMALGQLYGGYHARWLRLQASEWQPYRRDMLATVEMLTEHLQAELRAVRQLLMISDFYGR